MPTISISKKEMEAIQWYREKALNSINTPECVEMLKKHDRTVEKLQHKFDKRNQYEVEWKANHIFKMMSNQDAND